MTFKTRCSNYQINVNNREACNMIISFTLFCVFPIKQVLTKEQFKQKIYNIQYT